MLLNTNGGLNQRNCYITFDCLKIEFENGKRLFFDGNLKQNLKKRGMIRRIQIR